MRRSHVCMGKKSRKSTLSKLLKTAAMLLATALAEEIARVILQIWLHGGPS